MKKKGRFKIRYVILSFLIAAILFSTVFMRLGGLSTGDAANAEEFRKYAAPVENLAIPGDKKIIALGEATHGNAEFQQLKLEVFKRLVEGCGVRAFALEGDYGGCEQVNRYIHGGEGTAERAAAAIGFAIYRTNEMAELISYLREYNKTASAGEDIRFYGFDMQRVSHTFRLLTEACAEYQIDMMGLGEPAEGEPLSDAQVEALKQIREKMQAGGAPEKALHCADMLLQYCELQSNSTADGGALRDRFMAENAEWILRQEQQNGRERIFVTGHNSHIAKWGSYESMGKILSEKAENGYYAIGTDFYRTRCNMPTGSSAGRTDQVFYSRDPLAKAAREAGYDICLLDFAKVPQDTELGGQIYEYSYMGNLGEHYSPVMRLLPPSYRIFQQPAVLYDSMIFVADATPTRIIPQG